MAKQNQLSKQAKPTTSPTRKDHTSQSKIRKEACVKDDVKKLLKERGAYNHWPVQNGMGAACLDCHGCYRGAYFAVETKRNGKHPTPRQQLVAKEITKTGGTVFIVDDGANYPIDELEKWMDYVDAATGKQRTQSLRAAIQRRNTVSGAKG